MGYPSPLKAISRKLTDNIVISSCPFTILNKLNVGGRMALFNYNNDIIVWSPIPYGDSVIEALQLLTGSGENEFNITHIVVVNKEHNLAAKTFKEKYPNAKILASEEVKIGDCTIDYSFTSKAGNKLITSSILKEEVGVKEESILNNFQMVYLSTHKNKDLVLFDTNSKILFIGDIMFNLGTPGTISGEIVLEQFSPELGYPEKFNPHSGWSFMTRYLQPYSKIGNWICNSLAQTKYPDAKLGMKTIYESWDFKKIVVCHGNLIEGNAKQAFNDVFKSSIHQNI